jgi:hypothetical protein
VNCLNKSKPRNYHEGFFSAISVGFFLLLAGTIFIITPNLFGELISFFQDFSIVSVPNTEISFIGLARPHAHMTVYEAAWQFSIALAAFQFIILALRFVISSSWGKRSEALGNLVSTIGSIYLIQLFLIETTNWFAFWSAILIVIGISLIVRAVMMAISRI